MDFIEKCELVVEELHKFAEEIVYLGPVIKDDRLERFEKQIGFELPSDFKYLLNFHNGFSLAGTGVYGLSESLRGSSLDAVYQYEQIAYNPMPPYFLPFSADGRGNHYCFDLLAQDDDGVCPVVFWQHDFDYESITDVERCSASFTDWINEMMVAGTLQDYNYDGSEKFYE